MASAAEQLAASVNFGALSKAKELKKTFKNSSWIFPLHVSFWKGLTTFERRVDLNCFRVNN